MFHLAENDNQSQEDSGETQSGTANNKPDMSDWDNPAGSEDLRFSEIRKSFLMENDKDKEDR